MCLKSSYNTQKVRICWPMIIDLFASSLNHCCGVYFPQGRTPCCSLGIAFKGMHSGGGHHPDSSVLAAKGVVSGYFGTASETSSSSAGEVGPPAAASCSQILSAIVHASSSCVETIKQFAQASGFSH